MITSEKSAGSPLLASNACEQPSELQAPECDSQQDLGCSHCLLFEELAPALRLCIGPLRNWKYEGFLTPVHCIGRRPHFRLEDVRGELRRKGRFCKYERLH